MKCGAVCEGPIASGYLNNGVNATQAVRWRKARSVQ